MCDVLQNLLIGIISGLLSSFLVSMGLEKREKKNEHKRRFEADKQIYSRYIQSIRLELLLAYKSSDNDCLVRVIEDEPFRESFNNLSEDSSKKNKEIQEHIQKLKGEALNGQITEEKYKVMSGKLYQYSVWILKFREKESSQYRSFCTSK